MYSQDKQISDLVGASSAAFKSELVEFAVAYANQVKLDWQNLVTNLANNVAMF